MQWTHWIILGAGFCGSGVMAGAFGAHGLKTRLSQEALNIFEVAVRYQMYHGLALFLLGLLSLRLEAPGIRIAGWAFVVGIFIFSGSLYGLTLSGNKVLGILTPFGGLSLILGWGALIYSLLRL